VPQPGDRSPPRYRVEAKWRLVDRHCHIFAGLVDERDAGNRGARMILSSLLLLAAAAAPPAAPAASAPRVADIDFDLAKVAVEAGRCGRQASGEILVCGRRSGGDYPMEEWERIFAARPLLAETEIAPGVTGRAFVQSVQFPNGEVSKRIMVGIKLPF